MVGFIVRRCGQAAVTLLILSVVAFAMGRATGDPRDLLLPPAATEEDYELLGRELGLDEPLLVQYGVYLRNALIGDLGRSLRTRGPVVSLLGERMAASAQLGVAALTIAVVSGVLLGVASARRRDTPIDVLVKFLALFGQSAPAFWVGMLLIQLFAVQLRWFPSGTYQGGVQYLVLPALTLSLFGVAGIARLMRSSMLDVLDSEYIKYARIKGLPESTVVWKHAVRNALLPVVGFGGVLLANIVTQAIVVETVFAWPGIGQLTYSAVLNRDFPVVQGVVLLAGAFAIVVNTVVDIIYGYLDPRIRM